MSTRLQLGDLAPKFSLIDQNGDRFDFDPQYQQRKLVLFFYPKDDSPICTRQACAFRDAYSDLQQRGVDVVGINAGSIVSHRAFAQNHRLKFRLLCDVNQAVLKRFGVRKVGFFTGRETFVIDEAGKIIFIYRQFFRGKSQLSKVLAFLEANA
ncbi:peroxiredoxin [Flavobacterium sp. JP2137]|uniref:peroxiredoxin n=1 Tax=Flavobacterium sp. JP2137 TaxID=3414510 RepID=UPI003D2FDDF6